jgi:Zn-dependent protease
MFAYITYFLLALVIHEAGHSLAACICRVTVSEIGVGWGRMLIGIHIRGVHYVIRVLPVGAYVRLDLSELQKRSLTQQVIVLSAGVIANVLVAIAVGIPAFSLMNLLLAATNILPLYQQDGWKCGMVILRGIFRRKSSLVEWTFTIAGSALTVALIAARVLAGLDK